MAVVSDGAGSAEYGEKGSRIAGTTFLQKANDYLNTNDLQNLTKEVVLSWLQDIRQTILQEADKEQKQMRDYACTFVAGLIGEDSAAFIQIGDGAIVVPGDEERLWNWIFWPQNGEFANTTFFLTDESSFEKLEFEAINASFQSVALFTDGIQALVLENATKSVFSPFFNKMFRSLWESKHTGKSDELSVLLENYLSSPIICKRTDDDKSLIMATRIPPIGPQQ